MNKSKISLLAIIIVFLITSCKTINDVVYKVVWEKHDQVMLSQLDEEKELAQKEMEILDSLELEVNKQVKSNPNSAAIEVLPAIINAKDSLQLLINDIDEFDKKKRIEYAEIANYNNNVNA